VARRRPTHIGRLIGRRGRDSMAATLGVALPPVAILRDGPAVALTWWTGLAVLGVLFGLPIAILK